MFLRSRNTFSVLIAILAAAACETMAATDPGASPSRGPAPKPFSLVSFGITGDSVRVINGPPSRIEQKADTTVWLYEREQECGAAVGRVLFVRGVVVLSEASAQISATCAQPVRVL